MPSDKELDDFYRNYHNDFNQTRMVGSDFALNRYEELKEFLGECQTERLSNKGALLDVGCGSGDFMKVAKQAGWCVTGTEVTAEAAQIAAANAGSQVLVGDLATLKLPRRSFQLITSYHVIEHLRDPMKQIRRCHQLLEEGGTLFLETPNISSLGARLRRDKWSHMIPPEHVVYFSPRSLEYALRQGGFRNISVRTSPPQVVESIQRWPTLVKKFASVLYGIAPFFGMGAALQAVAIKD